MDQHFSLSHPSGVTKHSSLKLATSGITYSHCSNGVRNSSKKPITDPITAMGFVDHLGHNAMKSLVERKVDVGAME